ncbi:MAG: type VI secretion system baseplate subunit TssK [Phycisphaerae bacterium]|jgi:type VI secretion system protein ImpJ
MSFWTEIHWSEGMFLRPHHLQAAQRWLETVLRAGLDAVRPFAWGFTELHIAKEPLENFTLRLDRCDCRMKDGTWVRIPENTDVEPLDFKKAMEGGDGSVDVYLGIPQMQEVRANSVSLENPEETRGSPRYAPQAVTRRDENTGSNPQTLYVRKMRARLFVGGEDMSGYEVVRIGRVKRSDRPGALPELDPVACGPVLALQASAGLSAMITSLTDQVEAKDEVMAREAREHQMRFDDGVLSNMEHLLKLHALNESRGHLKALLQCPLLHPYDVFTAFARLVGHLSVFHEDLVPGSLPVYDHDHPGVGLEQLQSRITLLLDAMRPGNYAKRDFVRKKDKFGRDGLEVELDRKWIDENLEMFFALTDADREAADLEKYIKSTFNLKLASPSRAPGLDKVAVRGLGWSIKSVPAGTLPRRQGLHYFKVDKTIGVERTDFWRECEQERGIRMSATQEQLVSIEKFKPTLYVILKGR